MDLFAGQVQPIGNNYLEKLLEAPKDSTLEIDWYLLMINCPAPTVTTISSLFLISTTREKKTFVEEANEEEERAVSKNHSSIVPDELPKLLHHTHKERESVCF